MFCDEVLERVDGIAAGDEPPDVRLSSHVATCAGCAAALEDARRLERLLMARPVPLPPPHFTGRTLTPIRRERWRREQVFDTAFNAALVVGVAVVLPGRLDGARSQRVLGGDGDTAGCSGSRLSISRSGGPSLGLYAAAAALIGAALGLWWWAERNSCRNFRLAIGDSSFIEICTPM